MLRHTRSFLALFALAVGVSSAACGGGTQIDDAQEQGVTTTTSGLKVTAVISSVSLGDYSSNMQLSFRADAVGVDASVQVVSVVLVDEGRGTVVDNLVASVPQVWNGSGYVPWNQRITAGGDLKASYLLSSPTWSRNDPNGRGSSTAFAQSYTLRVTLRIDGVDVVLESTNLHREPQFQT